MHLQQPVSPLSTRSRTWEPKLDQAYIPSYVSSYTLRSMASSSHYVGTLPIVDPIEDALVWRENEMGRELKALKIKSEHPYESDFNTTLTFTSKIME